MSSFKSEAQSTEKDLRTGLPSYVQSFLSQVSCGSIGAVQAVSQVQLVNSHIVHVTLSFPLKDTVYQNNWQLIIKPSFKPSFNWAPHLTPTGSNIIDQHIFRAPAMIAADQKKLLIVIPDVDVFNKSHPVRWYMDMDAKTNTYTLGMSESRVSAHVLYERVPGAIYPKGRVEYGFYLMTFDDKKSLQDPFRKILSFYWSRWGAKLLAEGNPNSGSLLPYVEHTYNWAFDTWKKPVWQQFKLDGKSVGAPVFIVNVTQSPDYPGIVDEREFRSIWNQAWFSSLRSASGLYRYARKIGNKDLLQKALMTKELALSFPKVKGFFYGLIGTEMEKVNIDGKEYNRSKGWNHYYWGNSNRNPYTGDARKSPFHVLDMSWTANLMLEWYDELEKDPRLLNYAKDYATSLLKIQYPTGFFPGWLDLETLKPMTYLDNSPETSMSVTFLLELYKITKNTKYKDAALKAMHAVMKEIIPDGRWEDFETYWSDNRLGTPGWVGKKVPRNNMYKQNTLGMYWTAEALLNCYKLTGDKNYLELGQRSLDEMLMYQASWQPWFIPIKAVGGFGVMNADGEWNDARQSLFAELIIQYGKILNKQEYVQRGIAAMRASFTMMYCPENPGTKAQWEKKWPFFGPKDYGFMMENYGHDGRVNNEGLGIGEFTIYDWGNGAASEAYNRLVDHFGKKFIDENGNQPSGK